jgi:transposase
VAERKKGIVRLKKTVSKNSISLQIIKSTYEQGKHSSKVVERLGNLEQIAQAHPGIDPMVWAQSHLDELNAAEKVANREVITQFNPAKRIGKDVQRRFGGGYLFLQDIYTDLGLSDICKRIATRHKFTFDLDEILSRLVFGRILEPGSKRSTHKFSQTLIEPASFELQHVYRALEVIAKECDFIQAELYKNSKKVIKRNDAILFYDCTNFFFEIEQEEGIKQYGFSKEHRPNPIVQMGLFMDGDGVPLAFSITPGNTNEQTTLIPLEQQIIKDFEHARFIVCTDAGLSSLTNRKFNSMHARSFITTQSIKKLKGHLKAWATDPSGFRLTENGRTYDISKIDGTDYLDQVFFKERWIKENEFEQRLIVTFSPKYRNYQRTLRNRQIERAAKLVGSNPSKVGAPHQNDFKRFITKISITKEGEIAKKTVYDLDTQKIAQEEIYDGLYAVCTNLEDSAVQIAAVNKRRWQIEECFRIMKQEFKARPAYLSRDDRITAHFATCFIALIVYRILERKLD